ncbi:MAG: alpha-ketoglutarate-dependent dioxygenase AlkB [Bacteroidota bacterium]
MKISGIIYRKDFISNSDELFSYLQEEVDWDRRMKARLTASFGKAYNYSQMAYPFQEMPAPLKDICEKIQEEMGYEPNNCLINYYLDGKSKMGFHSDQVDILEIDTGVGIVSLGAERNICFRQKDDKNQKVNHMLHSGSFFHMDQEVQADWEHAIPKDGTEKGRMSLTFRAIK